MNLKAWVYGIRETLGSGRKKPRIMPPIIHEEANAQPDCPLFKVPLEIRDQIFDLALTPFTEKKIPYDSKAYYYRPNYRYGDWHVDTALLRTCRRIHQETHHLPARHGEKTLWFFRGPDADGKIPTAVLAKQLEKLHLFTQQYWLEGWAGDGKWIPIEAPNLRRLRITVRHSDWYWWEYSLPLIIDAKVGGRPDEDHCSNERNPFEEGSWGAQFQRFQNLKVLELELETVEGKLGELDDIVRVARDWRFPMGKEGRQLVCNAHKTKRTGWWGERLGRCPFCLYDDGFFGDDWALAGGGGEPILLSECLGCLFRKTNKLTRAIAIGEHVENDSIKAKERLVKSGVDFNVPDGEPEIMSADRLTYYVVTLVYELTETV